jgi:hypothetical protein
MGMADSWSLLLSKWYYAVESLLCNNKHFCSVIY